MERHPGVNVTNRLCSATPKDAAAPKERLLATDLSQRSSISLIILSSVSLIDVVVPAPGNGLEDSSQLI
jgi:hypothetical protein